jgi:UDP-glucose 4-epimerase
MINEIITGGAGFVASHLADTLYDRFDKIYLIDNLVRTNSLRNIDVLLDGYPTKYFFIHADVSEFNFSTIKYVDTIFHLAATRINRCVKFPAEGHKYVADTGFNVVDQAARIGAKLFVASSASVYASPKRFPIVEDDPCIPPTLYGAGKLYTEFLLDVYAKTHGLRYAANRFFSIYGPRMDCEGAYTEVIFNWLKNISDGNNEITVYGNPDEKVLDLVFVEDVVEAICRTTEACKNTVYNVSTTEGTTLTQLIATIESVTKTKLKVTVLPENRTDIEKKRVGDTTRLRSLGWKPQFDLESGIAHTYEWIKRL